MRLASDASFRVLSCLGLIFFTAALPSAGSVAVAGDESAPVRHARAALGATPLVVNEIMAGPARDWDASGTFSSRDDEWIELLNTGTSPLDLGSFFLSDGDSTPRLALTGTLGPGERRIAFGRESYDWERANGYPAFGFSLGNSGDAVMLWQANGADTVVVDTYVYRSHEAAADRAIGRAPDGTGAWTLFDSLNPYTGTLTPSGTGCVPSPATENVCGTTPVRASTWGRVKELYR